MKGGVNKPRQDLGVHPGTKSFDLRGVELLRVAVHLDVGRELLASVRPHRLRELRLAIARLLGHRFGALGRYETILRVRILR